MIFIGDIYQIHSCTNNHSGIKPRVLPRVYNITIQNMKFPRLKSSPAWNRSFIVKPKYLMPTLRKNKCLEGGQLVSTRKLGSIYMCGSVSFQKTGIKHTGLCQVAQVCTDKRWCLPSPDKIEKCPVFPSSSNKKYPGLVPNRIVEETGI